MSEENNELEPIPDDLPEVIAKALDGELLSKYDSLSVTERKYAMRRITTALNDKQIARALNVKYSEIRKIRNKPLVKEYISELMAVHDRGTLEKSMRQQNSLMDMAHDAMVERFERLDDDDLEQLEKKISTMSANERILEKKRHAHFASFSEMDKVMHNIHKRQMDLRAVQTQETSSTDGQLVETVRKTATRKLTRRKRMDIGFQMYGVDPNTMYNLDKLNVGGNGMVEGINDADEVVIEETIEETVEQTIQKPTNTSNVWFSEEDEDNDE